MSAKTDLNATGKRVAIVQSSYIPWKGYFDLINSVDEFILFDDVQYTRRDWRNRNQIYGRSGLLWLSIPVKVRGKREQAIKDTHIDDPRWAKKHWQTLCCEYGQAPFFKDLKDHLAQVYQTCDTPYLATINATFIKSINEILGIKTLVSTSMDYTFCPSGKTEQLVNLCQQAKATHYLSGPAAKGYLQKDLFTTAGITVEFFDYTGYPTYPQLNEPFAESVSILDLIFNMGPESNRYMKSFT